MNNINEKDLFAKIPPKVWRFNLLWLGGWSLILIATSIFFWFEGVEKTSSIYIYLAPFSLFLVNAFIYPFFKKLRESLKLSYLNWVIVTNGGTGLLFSYSQPEEFNGVVYLFLFTLGLIPIMGIYSLKITLVFCSFFLFGATIPYVFKILPFGSDDLFGLCFIVLTSIYFTILNTYLKNQKEKELKKQIDLKMAKETTENRFENAKALLEDLKIKNTELNKLEKLRIKVFHLLSHKIKTPLTLVLNPLMRLEKRYPYDSQISLALKNAMFINHLTTTYIDQKAVESENENIVLIPLNFKKFLEHIIESIKAPFEYKGVKIYFKSKRSPILETNIDILEKVIFSILLHIYKTFDKLGTLEIKLEATKGKAILSFIFNRRSFIKKDFTSILDEDASTEINLSQNDLKLASGLVKKVNGKFKYEELSKEKSSINISFQEFEFKGVVDALFILRDLDKAPIYKGHISPSFVTEFTGSFKSAQNFLENKRVKTIIFDNSIEESQEKIDFIQQAYNDYKEVSIIYQEKDEAISQKLFQSIEDEIRKSLVKNLPILFNFSLKDVLIVDIFDENKKIEENFKDVMKEFDIVFVKNIENIKKQLEKHIFKLVIIDTSHFGEKGEDFIKSFKERHPETKMGLIVPPKEHKRLKQIGLGVLFDFVAFKPIKESNLIDIIKGNIINPLLNHYLPYKPKDYYLYLFRENEEIKKEYDNLVQSDYEKNTTYLSDQGDILIIDSSDHMANLLKVILSKGGYKTYHVNTSKEAFDFIKENKIDLIISDWYLKDTTGIELYSVLNNSPGNKGVPFILMSSKTSEEYEILSPKEKPDGLLGKPFSDSECLSLVQNILKLKENISLSEWRKKLLDVEKENARQLDKEVKERTNDVHNILNSLSHSVFCINEELNIIPPISKYSEELFGESIEGKSIFDVLFVDYDRNGENYSVLVNSFELIFGEDEKQFLLVEDYLPNEVSYAGRDKNENKTLKISYKPIYDKGGILNKVLFVIEDYTNLKNYYQKALNDQLEFVFYKDIYPIKDKAQLGVILKKAIETSFFFFEEFVSYSEERHSRSYLENQMNYFFEDLLDNLEEVTLLKKNIEKIRKTKRLDDFIGEDLDLNNTCFEIISDAFEVILKYAKGLKYFTNFDVLKIDQRIGKMKEEKVDDIKNLFGNLLKYVFLVSDIRNLDRSKLSQVVSYSKLYPEFDDVIKLISERSLFISFIYKLLLDEERANHFYKMSILLANIPTRSKLTDAILKHNLISPYTTMLDLMESEEKSEEGENQGKKAS